jgi:hypothetical protein
MLNQVKNVMHTIGEETGDLAKRFGSGTADLAVRLADGTVVLGRRLGDGTIEVARKIGPTRGVIGLAVIAAAIGGSIFLVRYLRRRAEREELQQRSVGGEYEGSIGNRSPGVGGSYGGRINH